MLGDHVLAPLYTLDHRRDLWTVQDDHVAFAAHLVDQVLAGDCSGLDVVGFNRGIGSLRRGIDRDHGDAGRLGSTDCRFDGLWITRIKQDKIDAGSDKVVDLGVLLAQVVVETNRRDLYIRVGLFRFKFRPLGQGDEERIGGLPIEPSEMPIDLSSLAEAAPLPIISATPASTICFSMLSIPPGALFESRAFACPGSAAHR
jgi:hypothetical protein